MGVVTLSRHEEAMLQVTTGSGVPEIIIWASKSCKRSTFRNDVADSNLGAPLAAGTLGAAGLTAAFTSGFGSGAGFGFSILTSSFGLETSTKKHFENILVINDEIKSCFVFGNQGGEMLYAQRVGLAEDVAYPLTPPPSFQATR